MPQLDSFLIDYTFPGLKGDQEENALNHSLLSTEAPVANLLNEALPFLNN